MSTSVRRYRVSMEYAKLETAALAHVDDSYYYGAYCRKCKHSARLSLSRLRAHLGDDFPLIKVREKLRCQSCRSRQVVVTFLAPDQKTGSLVQLFREPLSRDPPKS
jgi:hypothetical protein